MGDAAKISPSVPSTFPQNAILSLLIIHIIPSCQIYVAIYNTSHIPAVSWHSISSYLSNCVGVAHNVSHSEKLQNKGCLCFLTCTNFETGSRLPVFSGIVVSARDKPYSTNAQSSIRSLFFNSPCSCQWRHSFNEPEHLPGHCFTHTQSFNRSPSRQICHPVHQHISDICSPTKHTT
jgi:hypothetical protein